MKCAAALLLVLSASPAFAGTFGGAWEGMIAFDRSNHPFDDTKTALTRIEVHGETVRVFAFEKGKAVEIMPGKFRLIEAGPGAVIFASNSQDVFPHKGQAETQTYTVARQGDGSLLVEYARVGQVERDEILSGTIATFGTRGEGVLKQLEAARGQ